MNLLCHVEVSGRATERCKKKAILANLQLHTEVSVFSCDLFRFHNTTYYTVYPTLDIDLCCSVVVSVFRTFWQNELLSYGTQTDTHVPVGGGAQHTST